MKQKLYFLLPVLLCWFMCFSYNSYPEHIFASNYEGASDAVWSTVLTGNVWSKPLHATPEEAVVATPLVYNQGDISVSLTAISQGTGLLWYTDPIGGTGSIIAPTPDTVNPGTKSYWVSSTNADGLESVRVKIEVKVEPMITSGCWKEVSGGEYYSLAIAQDGSLWSWGNTDIGDLAKVNKVNKKDSSNTPTQIGTSKEWSAISVGSYHSLALQNNGSLWAWGYNGEGQLGDGTNNNKNTPIQIGTSTNWSAISAGSSHSLALQNNGSLWAWGYNGEGRLGDGTNADKNTPIQIDPSSTNWSDISAGSSHSLALQNDGSLWAWGYNYYGQLGDGTTAHKYTPTQIGISTNWSAISAGSFHSLALQNDNSLWAWGGNSYGQLGDGTDGFNTGKNIPTHIGISTEWSAISAGSFHSLALQNDGSLWAWGGNSYGQLGDGTDGFNTGKNIPTHIGTSTEWSAISAGSFHSLALQNDGSLWAWGNNEYSQLGDGTTADKNTPTSISCPVVLSLNAYDFSKDLTLYPSPTRGELYIKTNTSTEMSVTGYDITGRTILNAHVTKTDNKLDISHLQSGEYILKIRSSEGVVVKKIVKQ